MHIRVFRKLKTNHFFWLKNTLNLLSFTVLKTKKIIYIFLNIQSFFSLSNHKWWIKLKCSSHLLQFFINHCFNPSFIGQITRIWPGSQNFNLFLFSKHPNVHMHLLAWAIPYVIYIATTINFLIENAKHVWIPIRFAELARKLMARANLRVGENNKVASVHALDRQFHRTAPAALGLFFFISYKYSFFHRFIARLACMSYSYFFSRYCSCCCLQPCGCSKTGVTESDSKKICYRKNSLEQWNIQLYGHFTHMLYWIGSTNGSISFFASNVK